MWQRIQTLYLALAALLTGSLFFSVKAFVLGPGGVHVQEWTYLQFYPYLVLLILTTLLHLLAIGTFKVQVFQLRTTLLAALLLLAFQGWLAVDYFTADDSLVFRYTAIFPLVAAVLDFLAARCILRDQLLIESIRHVRARKKNRHGTGS